MWPGPRPTGMPSFTLIHPIIWPQYTNVTDRHARRDRTDRTTDRLHRANRFTNCRPKSHVASRSSTTTFEIKKGWIWDGPLLGRLFVKRFALCYQTVVCRSVCHVRYDCPVPSVTLVYSGQTVRWIKMKLGMQVGLGPGRILPAGDPTHPPKGAEPFPNFPTISVVSKWLHRLRSH